jgi:nicotinamide phosphoribosyltransferase
MNPFLLTDAYKISHPEQYPEGTEYVYSNTTARKSRMDGVDEVVVFGMQYLIHEYLIKQFDVGFFRRNKQDVLDELKDFFDEFFGPGAVDVARYGDLHDVGYLPLLIKSLPEGTRCPTGVPFMTIVNTDPKFFWLTNFVETLTQTILWNPITCATIADQYRQILDKYAEETSSSPEFVDFQGHNFSMRGMSSIESGLTADAGHLLSFVGSDTLPGNVFVRKYYNAGKDGELVSCSVPATEHAVMCAGGDQNERDTFRRLIQDVYPDGIISIVSDTWNLWDVLNVIMPSIKHEIMAREGKVVVRPDSGDPVKIVCGYFPKYIDKTASEFIANPMSRGMYEAFFDGGYDAVLTSDGKYMTLDGKPLTKDEVHGCVMLLRRHFGGTTNSKGYFELDPHVGLIYGDSITMSRAKQICEQLKRKGYASTNVVLGIGSFSYQYNTRDTFSIACKATWVQINGQPREIFKDPVTDDGTKKSARGLLQVVERDGRLVLNDCVSPHDEEESLLQPVFQDGVCLSNMSLTEIRQALRGKR